MIAIFHRAKMIGVADFIDEARQAAERMAGLEGEAMWTPSGDMLDQGGVFMHYFLKKFQ